MLPPDATGVRRGGRRFAEGMSFEDFRGDGNTVDAVMRNTSVIGETARHVPEEIRELHLRIPWWGEEHEERRDPRVRLL